MFTQDTSQLGQFAQQWELRMRAREAAPKGMAKRKLRRLLANNKPFSCTEIAIGDSALF